MTLWPWVGLEVCACFSYVLYRIAEDLYARISQKECAAHRACDGE
jgi:hypothetical protein